MLTAIVGILLGNLLIATLFAPALHTLRQILGEFANIELPFDDAFLTERKASPQQRQVVEQKAAKEFNRLFREYTMSFEVFKKVGMVFVAAIIILACVVAWQMSSTLYVRLIWAAMFIGSIVAAGWYLQRAIAPSPRRIVLIDFLQNSFANLHMSSLFDCADLHINFGRALAASDPMMHFSIFQDILFTGYRFLMTVSDEQCSRIYFASYGVVNATTTFQHFWRPDIQTFELRIGDFSFSAAFKSCPFLFLNLWLFVPTAKGWALEPNQHPRILSEPITEELGGDVGIRYHSSNCGWERVDECVQFERRTRLGIDFWKVVRVDLPGKNSPQSILRAFKDKIEHCRGIQSQDYPHGLEVGNTE